MWILDTDGDALNGKRLWLRPGKKYLFGRTKAQDGQFVVNDKTISRQHLTVEVEAVQSSYYANPKARSRIVLKDLETKIGTKVNTEPLEKGAEHELEDIENHVQIGRYPHLFRITWVPMNFTFSFTGKEEKADPYSKLHQELGPLDIKILRTYECGHTTHVVARKRNTSKGLQALIDGKCIVDYETYVAAVVGAATPSAEGPSPLEEDFEGNLPDPLQYLPPRGKEPTERPDDAYAPDPARRNMFDGYTFIFCDRRQFENLLAPITEGRGKALLREITPHETTVEDFLRYVKGVAGEKGLGEFEDGTEGKGVVVVRYVPENGVGHDWYASFGNEIAIRLDHRLINQNEFLDAILGGDASVLRRPLEVDLTASSVMPGSAAPSQIVQDSVPRAQPAPATQPEPAESVPAEAPPPPRRGRTRRAITKRFQGFDDDFNPSISSLPQPMAVDEPAEPSQGLFVSPEMEAEPSDQASNKRKAPPIEEEEDEMELIAPAAASLKRRRLADDLARRQRGESTPPPPAPSSPKSTTAKPAAKKRKKEVDVLELARQQREKAEELARAERESLQEPLEGMDIAAIRNLAIIEEMPVVRKDKSAKASAYGEHGGRWDDRWNGRRNFKKFRHKGREGGVLRSRVIVPLEEAKKREFGIGEEYWVEERDVSRGRKKGKAKERDTQIQGGTQSQGRKSTNQSSKQRAEEGEESPSLFVLQDPQAEIISDEDDDTSLPDIPTEASRAKSHTQTQKLADKTSAVKNVPAKAGNKRVGQTTLTKGGAVKKARVEDSDDSEDELRFKFRKRG